MDITETCDQAEEGEGLMLNLETDTEVAVASAPDNSFQQLALEHTLTLEVITGEIEKAYARGTYHNTPNQEFCQTDGIDIELELTAMQGGATPRYNIRLDGQDENNLIVTGNKTGETIKAFPVKTKDKYGKKWKIKTESGKWKQFDPNSI